MREYSSSLPHTHTHIHTHIHKHSHTHTHTHTHSLTHSHLIDFVSAFPTHINMIGLLSDCRPLLFSQFSLKNIFLILKNNCRRKMSHHFQTTRTETSKITRRVQVTKTIKKTMPDVSEIHPLTTLHVMNSSCASHTFVLFFRNI
jgi:hypothetical protein